MGKFETCVCWKHEKCMDVFFYVYEVVKDNEDKASLLGYWMVQGAIDHWPVSRSCKLKVDAEQYKLWKRFEPKGELRYV
jgi:hypothetical protein